MKLEARVVEKPWGQLGVSHDSVASPNLRVGEICFDRAPGRELPVLIKYLYTSERLSIQVHPNNEQARAMGHLTGKDEMWIVLDADDDATIGLGLKHEVGEAELRRSIEDGSIVDLVDWRPVARGDVIYNRAGTIHAAGAGLVVLEVQQSIDLTYRLFDYGRKRELHLDEGLSVARAARHDNSLDCSVGDGRSRVIVSGPYFGVAWCAGSVAEGIPIRADHYQLAVLEGEATVSETRAKAGECVVFDDLSQLQLADVATAVIAWPAADAMACAA